MRITLIRPHLTGKPAADALEPLVFAVLARLTPADVELAFHDDRIEPVPFDEPTDLVAMTVETFTAKRAYQIAAQYRRRGIPVVMGGYHPTLAPDEALQHAAAIAIGDAEELWPQIISDARAGRLRRVYRADTGTALDGSVPDRSIFRGKKYASLGLVQYGRGCRFACDFCSIHAFYGTSLRHRHLDAVVTEIGQLRRRYILFADDNLFSNPAQAEALFRALEPLRLNWACQISADIAANSRLLDLMAKSGCFGVLVGLESLDSANLTQMKKGWNRNHGEYDAMLREFDARGMMVAGTFVFGYDHDTPEVFDRTLDFALRSKLALAHFNPLVPTPGTGLIKRLEREQRLLYDAWWLDESYRYGLATFRPRGMTADELTAGCFRIRRAFNSYGSILGRALAPSNIGHLAAFLAVNLISRKEILRKQWEPLGGMNVSDAHEAFSS